MYALVVSPKSYERKTLVVSASMQKLLNLIRYACSLGDLYRCWWYSGMALFQL